MAWLQAHTPFDPDHHDAPVIGIAATLGDHDSGMHQHQRGQLLFTRKGCTRITLAQQLCLLPPSRAAWIPAGVAHRAVMQKSVDYRSIYLTPRAMCRAATTGLRHRSQPVAAGRVGVDRQR